MPAYRLGALSVILAVTAVQLNDIAHAAGRTSPCRSSVLRASRAARLHVFDHRCHAIRLAYWPGGVPIAAARSATHAALHVTTGPYHWQGEPVEYVRIGTQVIRPMGAHDDWPILAYHPGRLRSVSTPDPQAAWEMRGGPLLVGGRTFGRTYDARVMRATTHRRALLWVEGGTAFASLEAWQDLAAVQALMRLWGYTHAFLLDGGSSASPRARNPVYVMVVPGERPQQNSGGL
ncbi:MAG: hypothetical protein QN152_04025 [Armatimonadota bacterium]|nr:hypothetical protein [Armatimonadota bacterium]MDR7426326.1 hypothetical protein [Armatimonadota bacterium]MDR7463247.1 hypothetical protein [Armatimonadota bacterium]MDR7469190.1 hypothetical protein [Armatimonadota bacterium]MDR7474745.1 hypothetical protein [Armatimonadota bacterium]